MPDIKLYGYCTSPYVRKVGAFLQYKGLDFNFVGINPFNAEEKLAAFGGTQVPVLEIDGVWKRDSTPIGLWLDEVFPEKPLLPASSDARSKIMEIDSWVSDRFMAGIFRGAIAAPDNLAFRFRAWRLAALVSGHAPLPEHIRHQWPMILKNAPFIKELAKNFDMSISQQEFQMGLVGEMLVHLGAGPFFGEQETPGLVDLSLFPQIVFGYMAGLEEELTAAQVPPLKQWLSNMAAIMPDNPILVRDDMLVQSLQDAGL